MAITPRHYLDFINHYADLFHEKRSELEEQQMHLNVGLRKIKETVDQVPCPHSRRLRWTAVGPFDLTVRGSLFPMWVVLFR